MEKHKMVRLAMIRFEEKCEYRTALMPMAYNQVKKSFSRTQISSLTILVLQDLEGIFFNLLMDKSLWAIQKIRLETGIFILEIFYQPSGMPRKFVVWPLKMKDIDTLFL